MPEDRNMLIGMCVASATLGWSLEVAQCVKVDAELSMPIKVTGSEHESFVQRPKKEKHCKDVRVLPSYS